MRKLVEFQILDINAEYYGFDFFELMTNAGAQIAKYIRENIEQTIPVKFICGHGNNGGDGLVISQVLKKLNQNVILYCLKSIAYKGDAKIAFKNNRLIKNNYINLNIPKKSVIIDCLFGIGLNRKVKGMYKNIIKSNR